MSSTLNIYRQHVFLVRNNPEIPKRKKTSTVNTTLQLVLQKDHQSKHPLPKRQFSLRNFLQFPGSMLRPPELRARGFQKRGFVLWIKNKEQVFLLSRFRYKTVLSMRIRCYFAEAEALTDLNRWIGCTGLAMSHYGGIARLCACMNAEYSAQIIHNFCDMCTVHSQSIRVLCDRYKIRKKKKLLTQHISAELLSANDSDFWFQMSALWEKSCFFRRAFAIRSW